MISMLIQRILWGVMTLLVISVLVFAATEILPGDAASALLGQNATPEILEALREKFGLNRPAHIRYVSWVSKMVRGDFGKSIATDRPVMPMIRQRVRNTFILATVTAIFAVPLAIILGLLSSIYPNSFLDRTISVSSLVMISVPEFFTAAILVLLLAVNWHLFPAVISASHMLDPGKLFRALTLPVLTLTAAMLAHMSRMTNAAILDILRSPYIEMALLRGVPKWRIIIRHALPCATGPIINVVAVNLGYLVSGVVIVESVFAYPGLGRMMVESVASRDVTLVQAVAMVFCVFYVGLNLLSDVLVILLNPKLRVRH